jgi:hypothetical protein
MQWREPLSSRKRCPKCHARMRTGVAVSDCPYCGYEDRSQPIERRGPPSKFGDTPAGLEFRVQESIAEAEGERHEEHREFLSYDLPRGNGAERAACLGFLALLVFLHLPISRRSGPTIFDFADDEQRAYIGLITIATAAVCILIGASTFPLLRRALVYLAVAAAFTCLADAGGLLPLGAREPLANFVHPVYAAIIVGLQGLTYLWCAWLIHRDTNELLKQ